MTSLSLNMNSTSNFERHTLRTKRALSAVCLLYLIIPTSLPLDIISMTYLYNTSYIMDTDKFSQDSSQDSVPLLIFISPGAILYIMLLFISDHAYLRYSFSQSLSRSYTLSTTQCSEWDAVLSMSCNTSFLYICDILLCASVKATVSIRAPI